MTELLRRFKERISESKLSRLSRTGRRVPTLLHKLFLLVRSIFNGTQIPDTPPLTESPCQCFFPEHHPTVRLNAQLLNHWVHRISFRPTWGIELGTSQRTLRDTPWQASRGSGAIKKGLRNSRLVLVSPLYNQSNSNSKYRVFQPPSCSKQSQPWNKRPHVRVLIQSLLLPASCSFGNNLAGARRYGWDEKTIQNTWS